MHADDRGKAPSPRDCRQPCSIMGRSHSGNALPDGVGVAYACSMDMKVIAVGAFEVNCVVLWSDPSQAWIIDPGADAPTIEAFLQERQLQVAQVVCTHGHIDHLSALGALLANHPVPVWMHAEDAKWAFMPVNRLPPAYPEMAHRPPQLRTAMQDGQILEMGGLQAEIICTPGHTPGGVCLYFRQDGVLLSGDTLFAGSVGRTDLRGGDSRRLRESLARLLELDDATRVVPGHGPQTTIGDERRENPYLVRRV